jgi:predicted CopG family antitoxin
MPEIELSQETYERLDRMREESESFDELVTSLLNIYEAEELTRAHGGDEL